jgi:hypothetical protein
VGDPASLSISVTAKDSNGVASVKLYWRPAGSSTYRSKAMAASGSLWSATLSTQASEDQLTAKGTVAYYVVATDASPAAVKTRSPATAKTFKVALCNHPPVIGGVDTGAINPYGYLYAGDYPCTSTIEVYANVNDPDSDSLSSVMVWFKPYGATAYRSYVLSLIPGTDTYKGQVSTAGWPTYPGPEPANYTLPWYFTATDVLGSSTKDTPSWSPVEYPCSGPL